jgi:formylglycine-generating enzyme
MRCRCHPLLIAALLSGATAANLRAGEPLPDGMARIADGVYRPFLVAPNEPRQVPVKSFCLDRRPVTNGDYLAFVRANPRWQRSQVSRLFADISYLRHWTADLDPGTNVSLQAPVTFVSWFAAKAYARWVGKRMPTTAEWESAAAASPTQPDGSKDASFRQQVLAWYATRAPSQLPAVGAGPANFWGVYDLHGLVWEWVADFNSALTAADPRSDSGPDRGLFCGAGGQRAQDAEDYPAFMRHAFRSSLHADYCVHNLGFRCARNL